MDTAATTIDAVYSGGVLRPLGEVKLAENEKVRLTITRERRFTKRKSMSG
jgi:predicted DNA-binding antitoxin AbrB/MazE fold protein